MYKVKTQSGITWQFIVSYRKWTVNPDFLKFTFNDGKELILPLREILSIHQER
jgi:hypothetical protein